MVCLADPRSNCCKLSASDPKRSFAISRKSEDKGCDLRRSSRSKWAFAGLVAAVAAFLLAELRISEDYGNNPHTTQLIDVATQREEEGDDFGREPQPGDSMESSSGDLQSCLTAAQLESHPILVRDSYRFDAVSDSGPTIASYRGLAEHELRDLAAQGDSAAMAILGAISVMRAREWPVEKAVPYLMYEDPALMSYMTNRPLSPEFLGHMAQARKWFYDAALHGRVMVLHRIGESLFFENVGAVKLGWIDAEEYDSLSNHEKTALMPSNVYNALSFEIAPELKSGPHGALIADLMPRSDRQRVIVHQLADRFQRDLQAAGLPPIAVSESTAPPMEDLLSLLCESERERLEDEREKVR